MPAYKQIEEATEIKRLNTELAVRLKKVLAHSEERTVGYPHDSFPATIHFLSKKAKETFWWTNDHSAGENYFGRGTPGDTRSLDIDIQFNFPTATFHRRSGGVFLRDTHTNEIILAHSGIVTLGQSRVRKETLFLIASESRIPALTSSGTRDFLFASRLNSLLIAREIEKFSADLRGKLRELKLDQQKNSSAETSGKKAVKVKKFSELKDYFDEYAGQRELDKRPKTVAECYHGDIVKHLKQKVPKDFQIQKSVEIDLFAQRGNRAFLFEAKTSSSAQSIFTATGQLEVLSRSVLKRIKNANLTKVMVLPQKPHSDFAEILSTKMGIKILVFQRSNDGSIAIPEIASIFR